MKGDLDSWVIGEQESFYTIWWSIISSS